MWCLDYKRANLSVNLKQSCQPWFMPTIPQADAPPPGVSGFRTGFVTAAGACLAPCGSVWLRVDPCGSVWIREPRPVPVWLPRARDRSRCLLASEWRTGPVWLPWLPRADRCLSGFRMESRTRAWSRVHRSGRAPCHWAQPPRPKLAAG